MFRGAKDKYTEIQITEDLTIPKLFLQKAEYYGERKVAMREKEFGIWRPITWKDYLENVKYLALGLKALGLEKGDKVAMIGDNRPQGLWVEMAALCGGGVGVWLFQDSLIDEVQHIVDHSDCKFLVGEGQEEVDKGLMIKDKCPQLKKILWDDPKGMRDTHDSMLMSLEEVKAMGRELEKQKPELFKEMIAQGKAEDIALLFYTSGTSALPKGVLLTHGNMLKMGQNLMKVDPCTPQDDFVSFLPFAWIGEQMMSISCGLQAGFTINFPEEPETAQQNIREIGPQVMFSPPRIYEQMVRDIQVKYLDATFLKRKIYEASMYIGYRLADMKFQKKYIPFWWKLLGAVAYGGTLMKLRDHLGLSGIRNAYTGGAAMGPDHFRFFHAIGVNLKQIYGSTEISGISVLHRSDDIKFETVGKPIPDTEIKITPDGEIASKSPCVFKGYYKMPEETARALREGWLYSGDTGFIDEDGHLVVFDRTKDIMILTDGRKFAPQYVESRLKFSPFIKDAWIIGDQKPCICAVICIDYKVVGKWAEDHGIAYTSYTELSQEPKIYDLVEKEVKKVNQTLPTPACIKRFVNLYKEFDADDDELTRTRKLRRSFVEERYGMIVNGLYQHNSSLVHMDTTITYEDGRVAQIKTDLKIQDVAMEETRK